MKKDKLQRLLMRYSLDNTILCWLLLLPTFAIICIAFGFMFDAYFFIAAGVLLLIDLILLAHQETVRKKIVSGEIVRVCPSTFKAYVKVTKENYKFNAMLIKLYVVDEYKNKYNYYYLTGSEIKFKEYVNVINQAHSLELAVFEGTKIIESITVDGEVLKDLYYEIKFSKKLRKPIVYNHIKYKRTKKAIYMYQVYDINDVQLVFKNAKSYEELYIVNSENKYVKIYYNQETNNEFYIDKTVYNNFDDFKAKLVELKFLFGNNLRVFYTLGNSEPTSFLALINEVK